jgi:alkanesulfonate monooxygenase SsuD/methylene tetrahydromethanopterin reductase-like flavin-dependent oxidoreductase (luciferase family)
MGLAAAYGQTWVTTGERSVDRPLPAAEGAVEVAAQIARLAEACAQAGRDAASIGRLVLSGPVLDPGLESVEAFRDTVGRYEEAGVTDFVVHWPRPDEPYQSDLPTFEHIFSA